MRCGWGVWAAGCGGQGAEGRAGRARYGRQGMGNPRLAACHLHLNLNLYERQGVGFGERGVGAGPTSWPMKMRPAPNPRVPDLFVGCSAVMSWGYTPSSLTCGRHGWRARQMSLISYQVAGQRTQPAGPTCTLSPLIPPYPPSHPIRCNSHLHPLSLLSRAPLPPFCMPATCIPFPIPTPCPCPFFQSPLTCILFLILSFPCHLPTTCLMLTPSLFPPPLCVPVTCPTCPLHLPRPPLPCSNVYTLPALHPHLSSHLFCTAHLCPHEHVDGTDRDMNIPILHKTGAASESQPVERMQSAQVDPGTGNIKNAAVYDCLLGRS